MPKTPDELPRYVIDEGIPEAKEIKILPEEQHRALEKLMKASGAMLDEEERDLLYKLRDKLRAETERVKSLRKIYIDDKPLDSYLKQTQNSKPDKTNSSGNHEKDGDSDETDELPPLPSIKHVVGFKPEEVIQRYIECWNQQKFGAEYDCFSREFIPTERKEYIAARQQYFISKRGNGGMKIDFGGIDSIEVYGAEANVTASKIIKDGNRKPVTEFDNYSLKLESGRWLIVKVEPLDT